MQRFVGDKRKSHIRDNPKSDTFGLSLKAHHSALLAHPTERKGCADVRMGDQDGMLLKHYLDQGVSKAELSRRFGVSRATIHHWTETGQLDRDLAAGARVYAPRPLVAHKLDPYKAIIDARLEAFPKLTDTEIRAYLAERWSRSQPKEAALDYMAEGKWEDQREHVEEDRHRTAGPSRNETGEVRAATNDNTLARIGRDIRRTAFAWRHAQTVASFVDGRREVLAAYGDLRELTRRQGDSVALGRAFRETLNRHAGLLKQAEAFRDRPDEFASLLAQRGGIARKDLDAFEDLHTRAQRHRRAATMRYVHRIKREAEQQGIEPGRRQGSLPLEGGAIEAVERAETEERTTIAAPTEVHADVGTPVRNVEPVRPDWYAPYMVLRQDWNAFIEGARQAGILSFYASGYADMIPRIQALAENPDVPAVTRAPMIQVLENHQRYLSTRKHIEDYLDQVDRHIEKHDSKESLAEELDMKVANISDYPDWRRENDRLTAAGGAILSDMETHGPHLDHILIGETRMKWALLNMSRAIRRDDEAISEEAIAAEKLLAQPETPEEREQRAELEALKFRRLQSAVDDAATQEEREAALKEFDDYVERHSDSPSEEEHESRSISRSWSIRL